MKTGVARSRPVVTVDVARKAIRAVIAKRGAKPMGASAWFRSLPPDRQASLRERFLGHFGQPASSNGTKKTVAKTKATPRKAKRALGARTR
jgi:hypothetical protein